MSAFKRELKAFQLKSSYHPQEGSDISGVVKVSDEGGQGYAYIKFSDRLPSMLGKHMPYGIGPDDQCYLKVTRITSSDVYRIFCYYLKTNVGILLWEQRDIPEWLRRIKRKSYEDN